jgi:TetR/AcrR family transcriptional regulator
MLKTHSSQTEPRKRGRPPKSSVDASIGIRKAALKAFALSGFNGVSIVEIAQMAGVAKPLVHYHYASKDVLWEAAVGEAVADLSAEIEQFRAAFLPTNSPLELLRMVARQLVLFASRHPELVRIVVDETGKGGARSQWLHTNLLTPGYATGKALLESLARIANARDPAVEHLVPLILGSMNFPFLDSSIIRDAYGVDVYSKEYVERHGEILFQVLRAALTLD